MNTQLAVERDDLLDSLAPTDTDTAAALRAVLAASAARRSHRRAVLGSIGALVVLALIAALVLLRPTERTQIVADGVVPTTEQSVPPEVESEVAPAAATPDTTVAATVPAAPVVIPSSTEAPQSTTAAPTTTQAPPLPLETRATLLTPKVSAGETASLEIGWAAGRVRGVPTIHVDWGDPAIGEQAPLPPKCDEAERPGIGSQRASFRYATPGRHQIAVIVQTCAPDGVAERVQVDTTIDVTPPMYAGGPGAVVVAALAAAPTNDIGALDGAVARYTPEAPAPGEPTSVLLGARLPALTQQNATGPATVLLMPAGARGALELRWPDRRCHLVGDVDLTATTGAQPVATELSLSC